MSATENRELIQRFWEEVWNQRNPDRIPEFVAEGEVRETQGFYRVFTTAVPDLTISVEEVVADDDRVAEVVTFSGTQTGPLSLPGGMSLPATGKTATTRMVEIWQVENGKLSKHFGEWDRIGLLQQLGVMGGGPGGPPPGQ